MIGALRVSYVNIELPVFSVLEVVHCTDSLDTGMENVELSLYVSEAV